MKHSTLVAEFQLSLRASLAAGLAVAVAHLLQLEFPIYAMITAVIVTDLAASKTRTLALPRLAGTVLGAGLGAIIAHLLPSNAWTIALGILVAMFLSHLLRLHEAAKVAGYVCGVVLLNHGDSPWSYALFRTFETSLGIGAAILLSFVPKLMPTDRPSTP